MLIFIPRIKSKVIYITTKHSLVKSMADSYIFDDTLESNPSQDPFLEKKVISISDTANGNYSGFIEFDTTQSLASCGRYVSYADAYIEIPFVVSMRFTTDTNDAGREQAAEDAFSPYMVGIKAGFHQLINSVSITYNGTTICDHQPLTNAYISFKKMTTMSQDDVKKWGSTDGFYPDTAASFGFFNAAPVDPIAPAVAGLSDAKNNYTIVNGDGYTNNVVYPYKDGGIPSDYIFVPHTNANAGAHTGSVSARFPVLDTHNEGFYERLKQTSYPIGVANAAAMGVGIGALPELKTTGQLNYIAKSYCTDNGLQTAVAGEFSKRLQWNMVAIIRLKDISHFFEQMPLVKGSQIRINIQYNSCAVQVSGFATVLPAPAGGNRERGNNPRIFLQLANGGSRQISGNSCPIMVSSVGFNFYDAAGPATRGNGPAFDAILAVAEDDTPHDLQFFYECGIARTSTSFAPTQLSTCRLYAPVYFLKQDYEDNLLSVSPKKTIEFIDFYSYQYNNFANGQSLDYNITSGINEPEYIVVLPYANTAANVFTRANNANLNEWQSPFDSAPHTTIPGGILGQFQIQVSGKNIFDDKQYYDFQTFINEVQSINAINGGITTGINNGLVGFHEWSNGYRYYVANLSRRLPNNVAPKSIKLQCQNLSGVPLNLLIFIAYKKRVVLDLKTGAIEL
jgi:hypothetical protein